ncbi:response regulator [Muricoccus aerilatus]|uniref:response regulator n=1 Tax=Muricoccus aerilatus TaxID=452982 RepID=UPI0005C17D3E|nr:response regulator [Roseomonas aerilata]
MPDLSGRRILVVEDEALIAMLIEDSLHEAGAEIIGPAPSAVEALGLIGAARVGGLLDAAVLDVRLQDGTSLIVADKLAALGVPFVFVTGYENVRLGSHGGAPVLVKPVASEELVATLADLLRTT